MPQRRAARLLVVDERRRVLLFRAFDGVGAERREWWHTPGGGLEPGESLHEAAQREALEELGVDAPADAFDGPVHAQHIEFPFEGEWYVQDEEFLVLRVDGATVFDDAGWSALERRTVLELRWWTLEELDATSEQVYPEELAALVRRVVPA